MTENQFQELKIGDVVTPHMISRGKGLLFKVTDKDLSNRELSVEFVEEQYGPFTKKQVDCLTVWRHRMFRPYLGVGSKDGKMVDTDIRTGWLLWNRCKGTKDGRSTKWAKRQSTQAEF